MSVIEKLKRIRNNYILNQVNRAKIPEFKANEVVRYHIVFSGRVQKVGFRIQVEAMALRLQLTGWVRNLDNGDVEMEVQGMENKTDFLLDFMDSLKRIKIRRMKKDIIPVKIQDEGFKIV